MSISFTAFEVKDLLVRLEGSDLQLELGVSWWHRLKFNASSTSFFDFSHGFFDDGLLISGCQDEQLKSVFSVEAETLV